MRNFVKFSDTESTNVGERTCYKLCSADGRDEYVDKTILVSCGISRRITKIKIYDEYMMHVLKTIALPEDKPVRQLTLNMPSLEHEDSPIRIELPMVCTCPHCAHKHHTHPLPPFFGGHHSPILGNQPLNPDLFDDDPICTDDECHCNSNGCSIEDLSVADLTGRLSEEVVEDSNEDEVEMVDLDKGICFEDYVTESYSNKVISKSMFNVDTKQIMVFVTEEI